MIPAPNASNIFVLTVLFLDREGPKFIKRSRTWGWFPSKDLGEEAIRSNDGDMYEMGHYNAAVLEEMPWGSWALAESEHWYWAEYTPNEELGTYDVCSIAKPTEIEGIIGFGMG